MHLLAGQVFRLNCTFCNPQKLKYFVIASRDPRLLFFLINSEPTAFQQARPRLMASILELESGSNAFLLHDSFLDCTETVGGYTAQEVEDLFNADQSVLVGRIDLKTRRAVRAVVESSALIAKREKPGILAIW